MTSTTPWASEYVGESVCKYGEVTGYGCGTISTKFYAPSYVPNPYAAFTIVGNNCTSKLSIGGDSGSPVFWNNSALGIVSGKYTDLFCLSHTQLIFDAIDFATNYSGISVMLH